MNQIFKKYAPQIGSFVFPNLRRETLDTVHTDTSATSSPVRLLVTASYNQDPDLLFTRASSFADMMEVTRKIAIYDNLPKGLMEEGKTYSTDIRVFRLFKNSDFKIRIDRLSFEDRVMISQEGNGIVRTWRHKLEIKPAHSGAVWTDSLEIDAGILTPVVTRFAKFMYLQRHKNRGALEANAELGITVGQAKTSTLEGR